MFSRDEVLGIDIRIVIGSVIGEKLWQRFTLPNGHVSGRLAAVVGPGYTKRLRKPIGVGE